MQAHYFFATTVVPRRPNWSRVLLCPGPVRNVLEIYELPIAHIHVRHTQVFPPGNEAVKEVSPTAVVFYREAVQINSPGLQAWVSERK